MSLASVRTEVKRVLDGATGIGRTHDYFRRIESDADWVTHGVTAGVGHVWFISLADDEPWLTKRHPANHEIATYKVALYGYRVVDDANASEKSFATVVENVVAAFRADKKLGGTVIESGPLQWREGGYRMLANVLCHFVRLDLSVTEQTEP